MNTAKRALIKLALVGTLAGGAIGMPLVASAAAEPNADFNNCRGVIISQTTAEFGSIGVASKVEGFRVRDVQQEIKFLCSFE